MSITAKENEILKYICDGYSDSEIARKLFISKAAVKFHVHNLLHKTGCRDRTQLVIYAFKNNTIQKN